MKRVPLTWLVVDTVPGSDGGHRVLLGRASYDGDADLLTVTTLTATGRPSETTHVSSYCMQDLAKVLLREMYRDGRLRR